MILLQQNGYSCKAPELKFAFMSILDVSFSCYENANLVVYSIVKIFGTQRCGILLLARKLLSGIRCIGTELSGLYRNINIGQGYQGSESRVFEVCCGYSAITLPLGSRGYLHAHSSVSGQHLFAVHCLWWQFGNSRFFQ